MFELWGIDDEKKSADLEMQARKMIPKGRLAWMQITIGLLVLVLLIFVVESLKLPTGWYRIPFFALWFSLAYLWVKRRSRVYFPEILAKEGRCTKCGFDLKENISGVCPECGERTKGQAAKSN